VHEVEDKPVFFELARSRVLDAKLAPVGEERERGDDAVRRVRERGVPALALERVHRHGQGLLRGAVGDVVKVDLKVHRDRREWQHGQHHEELGNLAGADLVGEAVGGGRGVGHIFVGGAVGREVVGWGPLWVCFLFC